MPDEFSLRPQSALDEDWYKKYNAAKEHYAQAAADSGTADTVTYYRVQGGFERHRSSRERIRIGEDGSIVIPDKDQNLSISAYNMDHALAYQAENRLGSQIVAFEVPRWFDDFIRQEAILQDYYKTNILSQKGAAPKMTDLTKTGYKFELPPIWLDWLEEYAMNVRIVSAGG